MRTKIQTGLRIPEDKYKELSDMSDSAGISLNSLALMLIDVGLLVIRRGTEEVLHSLLHNQQGIDG